MLYTKIFSANCRQLLSSVHDISDGGLLCAVAESCFGNMIGCRLDLAPSTGTLFSEGNGRFIVSVSSENEAMFIEHFSGTPYSKLGVTTEEEHMICQYKQREYVRMSLFELFQSWTKEL